MIISRDRSFEVLGMVKGNVVQSKNIGKDIGAGFKTIVGGELKGYTEMLQEARQIATKRMVDEAESLGADAVICVRLLLLRSCREPQRLLHTERQLNLNRRTKG